MRKILKNPVQFIIQVVRIHIRVFITYKCFYIFFILFFKTVQDNKQNKTVIKIYNKKEFYYFCFFI